MARVIDITNKLSNEKPKIKIGEKEYTVNNDIETVFKFEGLVANSSVQSMQEAIKDALGEEAVNELNVYKMSMSDFKVIVIAIMAAFEDIDFEEAEKRFQTTEKSK